MGAAQALALGPRRQHHQPATWLMAGQGHRLVQGGLVIEAQLPLQAERDGETTRCGSFVGRGGPGRPGHGGT